MQSYDHKLCTCLKWKLRSIKTSLWICVTELCRYRVWTEKELPKIAGQRDKKYMLSHSVWKPPKSSQALETSCPVGFIEADKLRTPHTGQSCTRPPAHIAMNKGLHNSDYIQEGFNVLYSEKDYRIIDTPDEARDPLRGFSVPLLLSRQLHLAPELLLQLGSREWEWEFACELCEGISTMGIVFCC